MATLLALIFGVFIIGAIIGVGSIWSGYVLSVLWGWFIVPTFQLPILTIPVAIGISLVTHMLCASSSSSSGDTSKDTATLAVGLFLVPLVALALGWIVRGFM